MQKNAAYLQNKLDTGLVVYGINTGFGGSADVRCPDTVAVQESLVRHLNAGELDIILGVLIDAYKYI